MSRYLERLEKVNKDSDKRTVYDSIDRPIRKLVYHMNRIGLKTRFSCCGFPYAGEEEPKTHYKGAYVQFYEPEKNLQDLQTFIRFAGLADGCGWQVYRNNRFWNIRKRIDFPDDYYKPDMVDYAIHDYECLVLAIKMLEDAVSEFPSKDKSFKIIDGNKDMCDFTDGEWQVKPKSDAVFEEEAKTE